VLQDRGHIGAQQRPAVSHVADIGDPSRDDRLSGAQQRLQDQGCSADGEAAREPEMLCGELDAASTKIEQPSCLNFPRAPVTGMDRADRREKSAGNSAFVCPQGKISILEIEKKSFIKSAKLLEQGVTHEKECAHDLVDAPCAFMRLLGEEMRRKH